MDGRDLFFPYTNFPGFYSHALPANDFYPHQQDVRGTPPFRQFIGPEPANPENQSASQSSACESPCTSNASGSPDSASTGGNSGKKSYEKCSEEEKSLLVRLWAENFDYLESKDARKVWERIARELSAKCGTKKTSDKCQKKMKYWIDRYKAAKDWNRNQSGGNRKQSIFYEEIDEVLGCRDGVTLRHVAQAGSSSGVGAVVEANNEEEIAEGEDSKKVKRTQRKMSRKRAREEVKNDEEKEMFKAAFSGMEERRKEMSSFMANFNRVQEQQLNTMNALVGALTNFLKNNNN